MEGMGGTSENWWLWCQWDCVCVGGGETYVCGYVLGGFAVDAEGRSAGGWWLGCLRA